MICPLYLDVFKFDFPVCPRRHPFERVIAEFPTMISRRHNPALFTQHNIRVGQRFCAFAVFTKIFFVAVSFFHTSIPHIYLSLYVV